MAFDLMPANVHVDGRMTISKGRAWWRDRMLYGATRTKDGVAVQVLAEDVDEPVKAGKYWVAGEVKMSTCGCGAGRWKKYSTDELEATMSVPA